MEYLLDREESSLVDRILAWAEENNCELAISAGSAYTMTYTIDRYLCKENLIYNPQRTELLREIMKKVFSHYTVESLDSKGFLASASDMCFLDIEDSYQWWTAKETECEVLLTINVKDYSRVSQASSTLKVLNPASFIEKYSIN